MLTLLIHSSPCSHDSYIIHMTHITPHIHMSQCAHITHTYAILTLLTHYSPCSTGFTIVFFRFRLLCFLFRPCCWSCISSRASFTSLNDSSTISILTSSFSTGRGHMMHRQIRSTPRLNPSSLTCLMAPLRPAF